MTPAQLTTRLATIPNNPTTDHGRGFLGPFTRATGHLLYVLVCLSQDPPWDAQTKANIEHAAVHLDATTTDADLSLSNIGQQRIATFRDAIRETNDAWNGWSADEQLTATRELANAAAALASSLDFELLGIYSADPGLSF